MDLNSEISKIEATINRMKTANILWRSNGCDGNKPYPLNNFVNLLGSRRTMQKELKERELIEDNLIDETWIGDIRFYNDFEDRKFVFKFTTPPTKYLKMRMYRVGFVYNIYKRNWSRRMEPGAIAARDSLFELFNKNLTINLTKYR